MSPITRRRFLKGSSAAAAGLMFSSAAHKALGANDDVRVAVVGCGGRGSGHVKTFSSIPGCRVVAVCDADEKHVGDAVAGLKKAGHEAKGYQDYRKLLEDKDIDAIATATPNHWHSLVTIWACQAGKDVYVEKPISHEIWEGRKCAAECRA